MNIETACDFLGWCTVISFGVMVFQTIAILVLRGWITNIHARMFQLDGESIRRAYFQYLAIFKILFIVFNLVPFIALKIMSGV